MRLITAAGKQLLNLSKKMKGNLGKSLGGMSKTDIAGAIAPDLIFGGMAAAMTPGDFTDSIGCTGAAVGGIAGGLGLRGAGITNPVAGLAVDYAGSIGGDMVGMAAADQITRMRHGGLTPMEQEQLKYQQQLEESIRQQVLAEYGINPNARQMQGMY